MFSRKQLAKLILPLVVEQFLAMTIGIADTLMVANCGEAAVSGISLVDSINILLINIFSALATGGAIVCSQYIGKEQPENARKAAKQLVLITAVLSVAIMVACLLSQRGLLRVLFGSIEDAVMENAVTYLFLSALSYPFIAVYNAGAALFQHGQFQNLHVRVVDDEYCQRWRKRPADFWVSDGSGRRRIGFPGIQNAGGGIRTLPAAKPKELDLY